MAKIATWRCHAATICGSMDGRTTSGVVNLTTINPLRYRVPVIPKVEKIQYTGIIIIFRNFHQ